MGRNLIHKLESKIFKVWSPFNFVDYSHVDKLIDSLEKEIVNSKFNPDILVGISHGGDYLTEKLSKRLDVQSEKIKLDHYHLKLGILDLDEIVGAFTLAKLFGYNPEVRVSKDISPAKVENQKVLILDDDSFSGKTLDTAIKIIQKKNPAEIKTGVLYTWNENSLVDFSGEWLPKNNKYCLTKHRFPWSKVSPYYKD